MTVQFFEFHIIVRSEASEAYQRLTTLNRGKKENNISKHTVKNKYKKGEIMKFFRKKFTKLEIGTKYGRAKKDGYGSNENN